MELDEESREKCVACLPWSLYAYNMLPMGIKIAMDVFQQAMGDWFVDLECVLVYLDDIIIIEASTFGEHIEVVAEVLKRLEEQGIQVSPEKIFPQVEYLGFLATRSGIKLKVRTFKKS